jgi:hypothetical protein
VVAALLRVTKRRLHAVQVVVKNYGIPAKGQGRRWKRGIKKNRRQLRNADKTEQLRSQLLKFRRPQEVKKSVGNPLDISKIICRRPKVVKGCSKKMAAFLTLMKMAPLTPLSKNAFKFIMSLQCLFPADLKFINEDTEKVKIYS